MNQQKMIEHIATEVMGWERTPDTNVRHAAYYDPAKYEPELASDEQGYEVLVKNYNPLENHRQAFDALDKLASKGLVSDLCIGEVGGNLCEITALSDADFPHCVAERNENLLHAICIAICHATGYEAEE